MGENTEAVTVGCAWGACLKGHTSLAVVGVVCHPNSPGWACLGSTAVCLLGGVSKVSILTPINSPGPLPPPALLYQGKATHGRSLTSPEGEGNWEGAGPEEEGQIKQVITYLVCE